MVMEMMIDFNLSETLFSVISFSLPDTDRFQQRTMTDKTAIALPSIKPLHRLSSHFLDVE